MTSLRQITRNDVIKRVRERQRTNSTQVKPDSLRNISDTGK